MGFFWHLQLQKKKLVSTKRWIEAPVPWDSFVCVIIYPDFQYRKSHLLIEPRWGLRSTNVEITKPFCIEKSVQRFCAANYALEITAKPGTPR
jgi:hypothetical protein